MSNKMVGQEAERKVFLSAHRCPEVDLLPHASSDTENKLFDNTSRSEDSYLDLSQIHCYEGKEDEKVERHISDWSEEDLYLQSSPPVVLLSDDENSGPESGFECVDVTMEAQANGQKNDRLKMVPKRQIHMRKKKDAGGINQETSDKPELALRDGPVGQRTANSEVPAHHCPHLLLRQQSKPFSLSTSSDVISCGVYKGLTGAYQGFQSRLSEGQRHLQKSFSVDESKTKMASCIIRNVLFKKMQVEQNTSDLKKSPHVFPVIPPVMVPVMGHDRRLVEKTCNLSLPVKTTTPLNHKIKRLTSSGQVGDHSSTYQQVLGIKGQNTKFLSKSSDRKQNDTYCCPITQQTQSNALITSKVKHDIIPVRHFKKAAGESYPLAPPRPPTSRFPQQTQLFPSVQEQRSIDGVPSHSQTPHTCLYKSPTLHPHLDKVSYVQTPPSSSQTQGPPTQRATTLQLHARSQNQIRSTAKSLDQITKVCPHYGIKSTENQEELGGKVIATTQQNQPQQQFVCSIQSLLPAQVCDNVVTSSYGTISAGTDPSHVTSRQGFFLDMPPQLESKVLLDPETGQFVQVFLPRDSSQYGTKPSPKFLNPSSTLIHTASAYPTSAVLQVGGANLPMPVMQLQPMAAVSSLYAPLHLPFTLHLPTVYTAP